MIRWWGALRVIKNDDFSQVWWVTLRNLSIWEVTEENQESQASLGYTANPCLKKEIIIPSTLNFSFLMKSKIWIDSQGPGLGLVFGFGLGFCMAPWNRHVPSPASGDGITGMTPLLLAWRLYYVGYSTDCSFSCEVLQSKEKILTDSYKFRVKDGSFVTLKSKWFSFTNPWTKKLEYIVSVNTLVLWVAFCALKTSDLISYE